MPDPQQHQEAQAEAEIEARTEAFYDHEDDVYRSFWDSSGSLHWGYFADLSQTDPEAFLEASQRWTDLLLDRSGIGPGSHVLDIGCGNGTTAAYLARRTGCRVTGIDISGVRVGHARARTHALPNVDFRKASAALLPFADGTFTHVWSQATLYHVPDRERALDEIHRVLAEGGTLVLDDLVTPSPSVTDTGRRVVYDRLMFEPGPSHQEYERALRDKGFAVLDGADLTPHLRKSYELLAERARSASPAHSAAYRQVTSAIDAQDVGWSAFVAGKVTDRLEWVYEASGDLTLREKYDAWSATYEEDLPGSYQDCPRTAASRLADLLGDRNARVLDVGAGTGLCGTALADHGFRDVTAVDLSDGMLRQAARKQVYRELVRHDIARPFPWAKGTFDAAVASGVFTFGHARAPALVNIADQLREGGILTVTFRDDYLDSEPEIERTISGLPLRLRSRTPITVFDDTPMSVLTFEKCAEAVA
ncbi:methyltransferase domain-containing protein [Streptomyces albireticuli]|uniref:methyltransferase domain-containing protein n=1 Tax=Streptomyces albireticuli TaxID=1940 RepID=UPI0036B0C2EE